MDQVLKKKKLQVKFFPGFCLTEREEADRAGVASWAERGRKGGGKERERGRESWAGVGLRGRKERRREAVVLKFKI